jgi:hypothetical protein
MMAMESEEITDADVMELNNMVLKFKKPYTFEGKEYEQIDLSGLENLRASDLLAADRYIRRLFGCSDPGAERTSEYACVLASKATKQPIEFFYGLRPRDILWIKNRVYYFLFLSV